ncbi:probable endoglucanase A [Coccomyxa sp. Obi]|nr:probable endoglucanase A [Coccomyxa sp. Obi]
MCYKQLEFEKVADEHSYEVAEEYLKKKHNGGDQDASLLESAIKSVELRNGKSQFKRSRSDRPTTGGRGRGGRGQYGMSRFNWSQAAMQMPAQMPMQMPVQQPTSDDPNYLSDAYGFYRTHKDLEGELDIRYLIDWDNMIYPTTVMLAMLTDNPQFHSEAQAYLQKWLCSSGDTISYTPLGRAYNRFNPALGQTMNAALVSVIYGQAIQPPAVAPRPFEVVKYNDGLKSQKYICWTRKQMRYILGDHGVSYVTGFPAKKGSPTRVYDRGASCPSPPQNCSAITALYNPAPNPHTLSGALVMDPRTWDFFDDQRSSNDTWVSIDNNVGLTGALAGLNQVTGTYDQCLQGYGILARDAAICDSRL